MKILEKLRKATMSDLEKVNEALKANPLCKPMNKLKESELDNDGNGVKVRIWLNPNNQKCFKWGWFEHQDFYDWTNGCGKIVKGDTPEEKQKFWEVAKFEEEHEYAWAFCYKKHFDLIDDTYRPQIKNILGYHTGCKKPLKITKDNHKEIISKIFGDACRYYGDTTVEPTINSRISTTMRSELQGIKETLFMLGIGYYGAVNLPEELENLSWTADICFYKSVYLYYVNNEIPLPDFDFVYNYKDTLI